MRRPADSLAHPWIRSTRRSFARRGAALLCSPPFVSRFRASRASWCASGLAAMTLLCIGCAGWRGAGDTFYGHRVPRARAQKEATYGFGQPGSGWTPITDVKGVQVAWENRSLAGIIELHAQCDEQGDSSLAQYTDHLRLDFDDWTVVEQGEATLVGRAARRTVVDASLDGIARRNELWVVKKNGCLFDLRYSASPADFAAGQRDFAAVVQGFRFPR